MVKYNKRQYIYPIRVPARRIQQKLKKLQYYKGEMNFYRTEWQQEFDEGRIMREQLEKLERAVKIVYKGNPNPILRSNFSLTLFFQLVNQKQFSKWRSPVILIFRQN